MNLNWDKYPDGLMPAVIQDADNHEVLMLGYMNRESLALTQKSGHVTFYSRSRQSLWVKGDTSGNFLHVAQIRPDCDHDALLILARPEGPTCHRGTESCFDDPLFFGELQTIIRQRLRDRPEGSYVTQLMKRGLDRIIQKVGEEAVETVIAAKNTDADAFEGEAADLFFHLTVLLLAKGSSLERISVLLATRHVKKPVPAGT